MGTDEFLRIESPVDAFVDQILAAEGAVKEKDTIFVLTSPHLDRLLSRITSSEQHLAIVERPFNDGRVDEEIQTIAAKRDALQLALTACQAILAEQQDRSRVGEAISIDVSNAQKDVYSAQTALADATMAADQAGKKKQDMIDKLSIAKDALGQHKTYLTAMKAALTISASKDGVFKVFVGVGSFVRKGHVLGEIEL